MYQIELGNNVQNVELSRDFSIYGLNVGLITISKRSYTLRIGECPSNSPFFKNNGRDTRTFSNLKATHCTLLILLIINLVTKTSLCIVSKVQREQ